MSLEKNYKKNYHAVFSNEDKIEVMEEFSNKVLRHYHQVSYPTNVKRIAYLMGFDIFQGPIHESEISAKLIIDDSLRKILVNNTTKGRIIIVNERNTYYEQNFSLAHMIANYLLYYESNGQSYYYSYNTINNRNNKSNQLARALMMPRKIFEAQYVIAVEEGGTVYDFYNNFSEMFCVPPVVIKERLIELIMQYE